jgi:hypothetical protein
VTNSWPRSIALLCGLVLVTLASQVLVHRCRPDATELGNGLGYTAWWRW